MDIPGLILRRQARGLNGDVFAYRGFAYVGTWSGPCPATGVKIIDVGDPAHPQQVATAGGYANTSAEDMQVVSVDTAAFDGDLLGVGLQDCGLSDQPPGRHGCLDGRFDESPMYPLAWNPPYYREYLEAAGYAPRYPMWVFEIDVGSERYRDVSRQMLSSRQCDVRLIDKRRWARDLEILRGLFNAGMRDESEMQQSTAAEFKELFRPIWGVIFDARIITQFAVDVGREIGFVVGAVDLVPLFRSFQGRMGLSQIFRLMRTGRIRTRASAVFGAALPDYRGRHIGTMAARFFNDLQEMGFTTALYFPVNDANTASRGLAEAIGGRRRVLYHCFDRHLG